jgi:hypothetical protein
MLKQNELTSKRKSGEEGVLKITFEDEQTKGNLTPEHM